MNWFVKEIFAPFLTALSTTSSDTKILGAILVLETGASPIWSFTISFFSAKSITFSFTINWIPDLKSSSEISPSTHHFALLWIHFGIWISSLTAKLPSESNSILSTLTIPSFTINPSPTAKSLSEINPCDHQSALFFTQSGILVCAKESDGNSNPDNKNNKTAKTILFFNTI